MQYKRDTKTGRMMLAAVVVIIAILLVIIFGFRYMYIAQERRRVDNREGSYQEATVRIEQQTSGQDVADLSDEDSMEESEEVSEEDQNGDSGEEDSDLTGSSQGELSGDENGNHFSSSQEELSEEENKDYSENSQEKAGEEGSKDNSEDVFLVPGEETKSNKYEKVNKLTYTDSVRYTSEELKLLDRAGLRITRNEIFARHGRMFNDQELQKYFDNQPWYQPRYAPSDFDDSCLNAVEVYNVNLILECEQEQGYMQ